MAPRVQERREELRGLATPVGGDLRVAVLRCVGEPAGLLQGVVPVVAAMQRIPAA